MFLRIENLEIENCLKIENWKLKIQKSINVQPVRTTVLDLRKSEEELLRGMHQKTRYNIRLAEKKGVIVREAKIHPVILSEAKNPVDMAQNDDEFEKFWQLMTQTKDRDSFRLHDKEYYQKMLLSPSPGQERVGVRLSPYAELSIVLYFAEHENKILAAGIFAFFGNTATYLHGASSNEYRNLMAPYLLQWRMIQEAKKNGCTKYDFYGIDEIKWSGVTRFKCGFGGNQVEGLGTHDVIFCSWSYKLYNFLRFIRRMVKI